MAGTTLPIVNPNPDPIIKYASMGTAGTPAPITSADLAPTASTDFVQPKSVPVYPVAGLSPVLQPTPSEKDAATVISDIQGLNDSNVGQSAYRADQEKTQGIDQKRQTISDLTSRLTTLKNEAAAIPLQLQQDATGRGITAGGLQPHQTAALRENAIQSLSASALLEAANGNLTTSLALVDRAVSQKFDPIKEEIAAKTANLDLILKSPQYSLEDKQRAQAQQTILDKQKADLEKQQQNEKDTQALAVTAAKNGADSMTIQRIQAAQTPDEALTILTASGFAKDPAQAAKDAADLEHTKAETAKLYADARAAGATAGVDPANIIAYAQQYASTGAIPTGLPKGTFGAVAQIAKEMPKPDGTLVDVNTGIKSGKLSATQEDGISALRDLIQKLDDAKTEFQDTNTGLLAGIKNSVLPSQANQRYNDLRLEISDLLARARTGAAINAHEEATYNGKLPGNFNQTLFVGANGVTKIDDLKRSLEGKLQSTLQTNGLSIYGYSTVKVGDQDYTVGSTVKNDKGQVGRVNPDGSITLIQ